MIKNFNSFPLLMEKSKYHRRIQPGPDSLSNALSAAISHIFQAYVANTSGIVLWFGDTCFSCPLKLKSYAPDLVT